MSCRPSVYHSLQDRVIQLSAFFNDTTDKLLFIYWHIYPPITKKRRSAVRARLGVADHLPTTLRWGNPIKCLSQRTTSVLAGLFSHCPFNAERQAKKL